MIGRIDTWVSARARRVRRLVAAVIALAAAGVLTAPGAIALAPPSLNRSPEPAPTPTSASIAASLSPDRPGARAVLTLTIHYAGGEFGVPSPVRRSVLRLPAGMTLQVPSLRSCTAARLRARGPGGCPAQSRLGSGRVLAETHMGSQITSEEVSLRSFLGPPDNLAPTFEIFAQGYTPLDERLVFGGSVRPDSPPYGEQLEMSIPPVPTLPLEPDASIVTFSLTVGAGSGVGGGVGQHDHSAVLVPKRCPAGGFPFAATFTYADGATGDATTRIPCPSAYVPARAARTIALNESGRLHLTSKHNFTLNEVGTASGTAAGTIYVHLTAVSSNRVTAEVNIYAHGGSLSGRGVGSFHRYGRQGYFSGSMSIDRGTGGYTHVYGSGLSFGGTIDESRSDAISVHVSGHVSD